MSLHSIVADQLLATRRRAGQVLLALVTLLVGAPLAIAAPASRYIDSGPAPAKADDDHGDEASFFEDGTSLLHSYSVIGGVFHEGGDGELSGWKHDHTLAPKAYGFRYFERNGFVSGTIVAIAMVLAGSAAASGPKKVESWESGGYKYTKYTYHSAAEKQAMLAATSAAASGIFGAKHQAFDLQVYSRQFGGQSEGYRLNMLFGVPFSRGDGMVDIGFGWGHVNSAVGENGRYLITKYQYVGMPFRLNYSVGPAVVFAHFDWNWLGHMEDRKYNDKQPGKRGDGAKVPDDFTTTEINTTGFPWRFGVQAALLGRLYLEGAAITPSLLSGKLGYSMSLGARF